LSLEERYPTREEYLDRVRAGAQDLVQEGYLLAEDLDDVISRAAVKYDYYIQDRSSDPG